MLFIQDMKNGWSNIPTEQKIGWLFLLLMDVFAIGFGFGVWMAVTFPL